jgi:endonuclease/exonuclease/phosphatase family metal-dependent hydrolase
MMQSHGHLRKHVLPTLTVLAAMVGAVTGVPAQAAPPADTAALGEQFHAMQWNIAGATTHDGNPNEPNNYGSNAVVDRMADLVKARSATIISVNEACDSQISHLRSALADRGVQVRAWTFTPTGNPHPACLLYGGVYTGVAILSVAPAGSPASVWFDPKTNQVVTTRTSRGVACLTVHLNRDVRVCTMHLAKEENTAIAQAQQFVNTYRSQIESSPWMLLGDFNATPDRLLGTMYDAAAGGSGDFYEADMNSPNLGQPTYRNRKIDYVFTSSNAFDRNALGMVVLEPGICRVTNVIEPPPFVKYRHPCSDHRPIVGSMTLA